jgi:hypothetical protein
VKEKVGHEETVGSQSLRLLQATWIKVFFYDSPASSPASIFLTPYLHRAFTIEKRNRDRPEPGEGLPATGSVHPKPAQMGIRIDILSRNHEKGCRRKVL